MKKVIYFVIILLCAEVISCQPDKESTKITSAKVPDAIVAKLKKAGFDTSEGLYCYKNGYMVENDILLTEKQIDEIINEAKPNAKNARVEHYRTNNLVTSTPRTLGVFMDGGFGTYMQSSFDDALSRYNAQNLSLQFVRVSSSSGADISIFSFYEVSTTLGYSAGFPSGGNPASPIYLNTYYYNNSSQRADAATVVAHEIGHTLGFRHTDFMNRAFSCGRGGNEGSAGVGALNIFGTPSDPSVNSWMLACSNNTNRPFTPSDIVALATVYPPPGNYNSQLNPNEQLLQNQYIRSADGRFILIMQGDGNLVIYKSGVAIWSSGTCCNSAINTCVMQGDGNLVLYDYNGTPHWSSNTWQYGGGTLVMQNDGNLVIYLNGTPTWASNTCCQ